MYRIYPFLVGLVILACQSEKQEITNENNKVEPKICDCASLQMDPKFNWFFLNNRETPFEGECEEYDGEQLIRKATYVNGKPDGPVERWYKNGVLQSTVSFKLGYQEGEAKHYDQEGNLEFHAVYSNGLTDTVLFKKINLVN